MISVIKSGYGFIKCCSRAKDLFFHFSELSEGEYPATGKRCSFPSSQSRERQVVASGVRFAPKARLQTIDERPVRDLQSETSFLDQGIPVRKDFARAGHGRRNDGS